MGNLLLLLLLVPWSGLTVIEGREPYHIEPHQCAEPSKLTYEISVSTATVTILPSLFARNFEFT